jgi:hypothetical protein
MTRRRSDPRPRDPLLRNLLEGGRVLLLSLGAGTLAVWACRLLGWL